MKRMTVPTWQEEKCCWMQPNTGKGDASGFNNHAVDITTVTAITSHGATKVLGAVHHMNEESTKHSLKCLTSPLRRKTAERERKR
mmetsp:Transcript_41384/g.104879  ORF Transcript_41384/g.104879 Transcript_41384/m.104879 type:complete len:85 (+) Transcript_41384:451-705(+)